MNNDILETLRAIRLAEERVEKGAQAEAAKKISTIESNTADEIAQLKIVAEKSAAEKAAKTTSSKTSAKAVEVKVDKSKLDAATALVLKEFNGRWSK